MAICLGDCLDRDGEGNLVLDLAEPNGSADCNGLVCDENGLFAPPKPVIATTSIGSGAVLDKQNGTPFVLAETYRQICRTITNDDPCERDLLVEVYANWGGFEAYLPDGDAGQPAGGKPLITVAYEFSSDGGATYSAQSSGQGEGGPPGNNIQFIQQDGREEYTRYTLAPGDSRGFCMRYRIARLEGNANGDVATHTGEASIYTDVLTIKTTTL